MSAPNYTWSDYFKERMILDSGYGIGMNDDNDREDKYEMIIVNWLGTVQNDVTPNVG